MKSVNIKSFLTVFAVLVFCGLNSFSQQDISPEKKALIQELRQLTESATFVTSSIEMKANINVKTDDLENNPSLTEAQKQEVRKLIAESKQHLDLAMKNYLADQTIVQQINDDIGFQLFDTNFTDDELKELIAFYKTPIGQKAAKNMPAIRSQLLKSFAKQREQKAGEFMTPVIKAEMERLQKKVAELK